MTPTAAVLIAAILAPHSFSPQVEHYSRADSVAALLEVFLQGNMEPDALIDGIVFRARTPGCDTGCHQGWRFADCMETCEGELVYINTDSRCEIVEHQESECDCEDPPACPYGQWQRIRDNCAGADVYVQWCGLTLVPCEEVSDCYGPSEECEINCCVFSSDCQGQMCINSCD